MLSEAALDFLATRKLDPETLGNYGVESTNRGNGEWLKIPFMKTGKAVNHKYRTIAGEKRYSQDKDATKCLWNEDVLWDDTLIGQPVIITEGELDAFTAIQCGYPRTVSVPDGAPHVSVIGEHSAKYDYMPPVVDRLREIHEDEDVPVILATDGDAPGRILMQDLANLIGRIHCKWLVYPIECKDLNDALKRFGQRGVTETIQRARWMDIPGTYMMSELPDEPEPQAMTLNMDGLGRLWRPRFGDFVVCTGTPGSGKTSLVNDVCCRLARDYQVKTTWSSFEQHPRHDHQRALRIWHSQKITEDQAAGDIVTADQFIDENFRFVWPSLDDEVTLAWLLERLANDVVRHGTKICVVDPWNELDHDRPPDMTLTEYVGFGIRQMRRFARKHMVLMIVCAHPAKLQPDRKGNLPKPTLYDISDSSHWANKADVGIIVHRGSEMTTVNVAKARYEGINGKIGNAKLQFSLHSHRFNALTHSDGAFDFN